jgi:Golgi nucleoside diphosphatase
MAETTDQSSLLPPQSLEISQKSNNFMPKGNNSGTCSRIMKKVSQTSCRSATLFIGAIVLIAFSLFYYLTRTVDQDHFGIHETSSGTQLKILSQANLPELTDIELDALPKESFNYLAMIDAGSSGCRVHVYRYGRLGSATGPIYVLPRDKAKKVKPGLSSFVNNTQDAGPSLKGLVDFIKEQVPKDMWPSTPIWLKATAGLRMLSTQQADAILNSVRDFLSNSSSSPFYFRRSYAKLISGNEEGAYGWISFNYMKRIIGPVKGSLKETPYVVIEMGGASSQVSQLVPSQKEADEIPVDYKFTFRLENEVYTLYTHSYLGYGLEQAREKVNQLLLTTLKNGTISDPCLNPGYDRRHVPRTSRYDGPEGSILVVGSSDASGSCRNIVDNIFPANKECPFGPEKSYSFDCVYQPKFIGQSTNILVFENFFYIASGVNIPSATTSTDTGKAKFPLSVTPDSYAKASDKVCGETWENLTTGYPKDGQGKDNNNKWCFGSSYAEKFITKGLGLQPNKVITISKDVDGSEIEWALGAAFKEALEFARSTNLRVSQRRTRV